MSEYPELRKLQDIIDNQADRILDLEAALRETGAGQMSELEQKAWDKGYACGKLDAAARIEQLEARLDRAVTRGLEQVEYIATLEAALREIDNMAPATCEMTLAHQMADIARAAIDQKFYFDGKLGDTGPDGKHEVRLLPCPVCGGEAIHAIDTLKRTVIQSPPKEPERDIDAERLDASGSYWPDGRRPPDAIG